MQTDAQLLAQWRSTRSEAAFAEIVARHGMMVLRTCRRVLTHQQDAEDAAQSVFLVLARNPESIREELAAWLYGTARYAALHALRSTVRRRSTEQGAAVMASSVKNDEKVRDRDANEDLNRALEHLSSRQRSAIVHRYLEGQSADAAARALGMSQRTLERCTREGLGRLRVLLSRHGSTLNAASIAGLLLEFGSTPLQAETLKVLSLTAVRAAAGSHVGQLSIELSKAAQLARMKAYAMKMAVFACVLTGGLFAGRAFLSPHSAQVTVSAPFKLAAEFTGHNDVVTSVKFLPNGDIVSGSADKTVRIFSTSQRTTRHVLNGHTAAVTCVQPSPDGSLVASASQDHTVKLWNAADGTLAATLDGSTNSTWGLAFSPDGKFLAVACDDWTVRVWDVASRTSKFVLRGHSDVVRAVAYAPDGKHLISGGNDQQILIWNAETGVLQSTLKAAALVWSLAYSHDHTLLASAGYEGAIEFWDAATLQPLPPVKAPGTRYSIAFAPGDQKLAAAVLSGTIEFWSIATREKSGTLRIPDELYSVDYDEKGRVLTAGGDRIVRLWEPAAP